MATGSVLEVGFKDTLGPEEVSVTVEYQATKVHKTFKTRKEAERYLSNLKGRFLGYFDDQTYAVMKL